MLALGWGVALGLCVLCGPRLAQALDAPAVQPARFVNLFHDACMVYMGQDQALDAILERNGFRILPMGPATAYLQGGTGLAWAAPKSLGDLVVAVRDDGICAVFARRASEAQVREAFDGLVRAAASPVLPVMREPDRVLDSPTGPMNFASYLQGRPSGTAAIQFTLATTTSAAAPDQAIATLSLVDRPAVGPQ